MKDLRELILLAIASQARAIGFQWLVRVTKVLIYPFFVKFLVR